MPMTTYLSKGEFLKTTSNGEINRLLEEVRKGTHRDYRVSEHEEYSESWHLLKRPSPKLYYTVYYGINDFHNKPNGEFQVINFYSAESGTSINTIVSPDIVTAYFYGILTGLQLGKGTA